MGEGLGAVGGTSRRAWRRPHRRSGLTPTILPIVEVGDEAYTRWRETNVLAQKQFGFVMAVASVPLGDVTSDQSACWGSWRGVRRRHDPRDARSDLVFRW